MKLLDPTVLTVAVQRIVTALQPEAVYLYGSHAYGQPHEDSDVDLLIIVRDSALPPHRRAIAGYHALRGLCLPIEIKVLTCAEFERRAQWLSSLERTVNAKGKLLYEAPTRRSQGMVAESL